MQGLKHLLTMVGVCAVLAPSLAAQGRGGRAPVVGTRPAPFITEAQKQELDRYIARAMAASGVPGLALAVVQKDSVVLVKGYGVKELGKPDKVDERTLFAIGSNTKTMTAAIVGMLVDEGKLSWNEPIQTYLPEFRVADEYVSRNITLRDIFSHRTGVENNTAVWYGTPLTRAQLIRKMRYLPQSVPFRTQFLYNNLMVMVAGEVAAAVSGKSWETLLQERIFNPLAMTASLPGPERLTPRHSVAAPHIDSSVVPHRMLVNIAPAGAVYSNAVDMGQYLRLHLANGAYQGKRLISERSMAEMRTLINPSGSGPTFRSDTTDTVLGLAISWVVGDFRGRPVLRHGGGIDGMLSDMQFLPVEQIGVAVLTNTQDHSMHQALISHIYDVLLGLPQREWDVRLRAGGRGAVAQAAAGARGGGATGAVPANRSVWLPLERYVGTFVDPMLDTAKVALENGKLTLTWHPGWKATLEPWQYNTFLLTDQTITGIGQGARRFASFNVDANGRPTAVSVSGVAGVSMSWSR